MNSVASPNIGGRPSDPVWEHFVKGEINRTTSRRSAQCKYCDQTFKDGRVENLRAHLITRCAKVRPDVKQKVEESVTNKVPKSKGSESHPPHTAASQPAEGDVKKKPSMKRPASTTKCSGSTVEVNNTDLFKWMVTSDIPFATLDNPFFHQWVAEVSFKRSSLPSSDYMLNTLLPQQFGIIQQRQKEILSAHQCFTISFDGFATCNSHQSVYACTVILPGGKALLIWLKDLSGAMSSAEDLQAIFEQAVDEVGRKHVAAIVTDGPPVFTTARQNLVQKSEYRHILDTQCMVHALSLLMESICGHAYMTTLIARAQRVVQFFMSSETALAQLTEEARQQSITSTVITSNKTRITSITECFQSIIALEPVLLKLGCEHAHIFNSALAIETTLKDAQFYIQLKEVCKVLRQLGAFIEVLQKPSGSSTNSKSKNSPCSTPADLTRHWILLGISLSTAVRESILPIDFLQHVTSLYIRRVGEMDLSLCRLALFMDPRYKDVISEDANVFKELIKLACTIMKNRGFGLEKIQELITSLQKYKAGVAYNTPCFGDVDLRAWWQSAYTEESELLVSLGILLQDVIPRAGTLERTFSLLGHMKFARRNRMNVEVSCMRETAKMYYLTHEFPAAVRVDPVPVQVSKKRKLESSVEGVNGEGGSTSGKIDTAPPEVRGLHENLGVNLLHDARAMEAGAGCEDSDYVMNEVDIDDVFGALEFGFEEEKARVVGTSVHVIGEDVHVCAQQILDVWQGFNIHSPVLASDYKPAKEQRKAVFAATDNSDFDLQALIDSTL